MKFNEQAQLDTSQVEDRRGSGGGGGGLGGGGLGGLGGLGGGLGGLGKGGGALGLIVVLVLVGIQMFSGGGGASGQSRLSSLSETGGTADTSELAALCKTGADANNRDDCRAVAVINSIQAYWTDTLAKSSETYRQARTVFYSGATSTACGQGSAGMGPFYCPGDETIYIDLSFWRELETTFGSNGAPFTQAYVIAHEYGHHIQHILGVSNGISHATGPTSDGVRLELQADCLAGSWGHHATTVPGGDGQVLITEISPEDLANAQEAASKIGDDWIQTRMGGGRVDESSFSHGSSAQREKWFMTGWTTGDPAKCDTFNARDLG